MLSCQKKNTQPQQNGYQENPGSFLCLIGDTSSRIHLVTLGLIRVQLEVTNSWINAKRKSSLLLRF